MMLLTTRTLKGLPSRFIVSRLRSQPQVAYHFSSLAVTNSNIPAQEYQQIQQLCRLSESPSKTFDFFKIQDYEVIFPEDSETNYAITNELVGRAIYGLQEHLADVISLIKEDIQLYESEQSNKDKKKNATNDGANKVISYLSLKRQKPSNKEFRLAVLSSQNDEITKNCTAEIVTQLIDLLLLYEQLPSSLILPYQRKIQQLLHHTFYHDSTVHVPLRQLRKLLFLAVKNSFGISTPLCQQYLSFHPSKQRQGSKQQQKESAENEILRFDNQIDLTIYLHILKDFPLAIRSPSLKQEARIWLEGLAFALETKKHQMRFQTFLMLFSSLCQVSASNEQAKIELQVALKSLSGVAARQFEKITSIEHKIEVIVLLTIAGEREVASIFLTAVKNQVKLNVDMLRLSEGLLNLICDNTAILRKEHPECFEFLTKILLEHEHLSSKCYSNILSPHNNIAEDLPFVLKIHLMNLIKNDQQQASPLEYFPAKNGQYSTSSQRTLQKLLPAHPSLRFQLGFQVKLEMFTKLAGQMHIEEGIFIELLQALEEYDSRTICEELSFHGINQALMTCSKLHLLESQLFVRLEPYFQKILKNHKFEDNQLWSVVSLMQSYSVSAHVQSPEFLAVQMHFLVFNAKRLTSSFQGIVYTVLSHWLLRVHEKDYGEQITVNANILPSLKIIISEMFNNAEPVTAANQLKINPLILKSFASTLEITAPEYYHSLPELARISELTVPPEARLYNGAESQFAEQLQKLLQELGLEFQKQYLVGVYRVDFYVPEYKLIVEVNGPTHYSRNSTKTTMKHRIKMAHLKHLGFEVFDVPYMPFTAADKDKKPAVISDIKNRLAEVVKKLRK